MSIFENSEKFMVENSAIELNLNHHVGKIWKKIHIFYYQKKKKEFRDFEIYV